MVNWGLFLLAATVVMAIMIGVFDYAGKGVGMGDGAAWYYTKTPYDWTDRPDGVAEYRYSPAFLWITEPFRWVSFELYQVLWVALHFIAVAWLAPWMLAFPGVADDVITGNVNTFIAVAIVLAVRGVPLWPLVFLTKVTPGIGVLYHVGRRAWRVVASTLAVTLAIALTGYALDPGLWEAWVGSLQAGPDTYKTVNVLAPLPVRMAIGSGVCLISARRPWLLPVGVLVAMPGLWPSSFAVLAAIPRLRRQPATQAAEITKASVH